MNVRLHMKSSATEVSRVIEFQAPDDVNELVDTICKNAWFRINLATRTIVVDTKSIESFTCDRGIG